MVPNLKQHQKTLNSGLTVGLKAKGIQGQTWPAPFCISISGSGTNPLVWSQSWLFTWPRLLQVTLTDIYVVPTLSQPCASCRRYSGEQGRPAPPLGAGNLDTKQVWCFVTSKAPLFSALLRREGKERGRKEGGKEGNVLLCDDTNLSYLKFLFEDY